MYVIAEKIGLAFSGYKSWINKRRSVAFVFIAILCGVVVSVGLVAPVVFSSGYSTEILFGMLAVWVVILPFAFITLVSVIRWR